MSDHTSHHQPEQRSNCDGPPDRQGVDPSSTTRGDAAAGGQQASPAQLAVNQVPSMDEHAGADRDFDRPPPGSDVAAPGNPHVQPARLLDSPSPTPVLLRPGDRTVPCLHCPSTRVLPRAHDAPFGMQQDGDQRHEDAEPLPALERNGVLYNDDEDEGEERQDGVLPSQPQPRQSRPGRSGPQDLAPHPNVRGTERYNLGREHFVHHILQHMQQRRARLGRTVPAHNMTVQIHDGVGEDSNTTAVAATQADTAQDLNLRMLLHVILDGRALPDLVDRFDLAHGQDDRGPAGGGSNGNNGSSSPVL